MKESNQNHWITSSCSFTRATEEDESSCFLSNPATNKISLSTVAAPLPCLNVRRGEGDATACVFFALSWLDEVSVSDSINICVHV